MGAEGGEEPTRKGRKNLNLFDKPNGQSEVYFGYAAAKKGA